MVEEFQPDVVMTDIKMPYMDGMELSGHIKEKFPAQKSCCSPALMLLSMQRRQFILRSRSTF